MPVYKKSDIVNSGRNCCLPRQRYTLRGLKQTFGMSSNDNPMVTWECEIMAGPDGSPVIEVDSKKFDIAGVPVRFFITYTEKTVAQVLDLFEKLGHGEIEEIDTENPPDTKFLDGLVFDAILSAEPRVVRQQRKQGQAVGEPILDKDGKEITNGIEIKAFLNEILGVTTLETGRPY